MERATISRDEGKATTPPTKESVSPATESEIARLPSTEPPPNGGWAAWSQVIGGHIIAFFVWGNVQSFGMFQEYYSSLSLASASNISWIGSTVVFLLMLLPLWTGSASDLGHFRFTLRLGILLYLIGVFMTSVCKEYWQFFLAQGVCIGLANGCMFVPTVSVVSTYFDNSKRSGAIGIVLSGSGVGGIVIPIMLNKLFKSIGFAWAVRCFGFTALVLLVLAERLLKKRLPPKSSAKIFEPSELKDIVFTLFVVGCFLNWIGLFFAFFYINSYTRKTFGLSLDQTIPYLMILNGLGVPGRIIPNYLADRLFCPIQVSLAANFMVALLFFVWIAIKSTAGMYAFAVVYGFFGASIQSIFPVTMADLTTDPKRTGTRLGLGFAITSFGVLIGSPVGGQLVQAGNGSYLYAQVFAGSCTILGFCMVLLAAIVHSRKRGRT